MKKTNNLFKILIPTMLGTTALAVLCATLTLYFTYSNELGNINMRSTHAIFFVATLLIALVIPFVFVINFKELKITRTKRDLLFGKIASALFFVSLVAFSISDIAFMDTSADDTPADTVARIIRFIVFFLVATFTVLEILPSKIKISPFVKHFSNACVPIYTAISIIALYFNSSYIPEYFKIMFIIAYSALTLFFLYDFKWRLVQTNAKAYTAIASMAFTLPTIVSLTSIIGFIFKNDELSRENITITIFEMIFVLALAIYALSKVLAIKVTVNYVVVESEKRRIAKQLKEQKKQAEEDAKFEARKAEIETLNKNNAKKANKDNN